MLYTCQTKYSVLFCVILSKLMILLDTTANHFQIPTKSGISRFLSNSFEFLMCSPVKRSKQASCNFMYTCTTILDINNTEEENWQPAFSPLPTMFSVLSGTNFIILATLVVYEVCGKNARGKIAIGKNVRGKNAIGKNVRGKIAIGKNVRAKVVKIP